MDVARGGAYAWTRCTPTRQRFDRANAVGVLQDHQPWEEEDVFFESGNYYTPVQRIGYVGESSRHRRRLGSLWLFGLSKSRRKAVLCEGANLGITHGLPANAEVREIAGPRQTEHPEVNR